MKLDPKLLILLPFGLAACGGGSNDPNAGHGVPLSELAPQAQELLDDGDVNHLPAAQATLQGIVDANALAATGNTAGLGTASYSGGLVAAAPDDEFFVTANVALTANFGDGAVTGSITDVFDSDEGYIDSDLSVAGTIDADRLAASISGQVDPGAPDAVDISGDLTGEFRGEDAGMVAGGVTINVDDPMGENFRLQGGWSASKN